MQAPKSLDKFYDAQASGGSTGQGFTRPVVNTGSPNPKPVMLSKQEMQGKLAKNYSK